MPVSSAFFAWREAEHAALHAQSAIHGAHLDHWIGQAPAPDRETVERAHMLQALAHELFVELMSQMQGASRGTARNGDAE